MLRWNKETRKALDILESLRGGLIVSCQALEEEPLHGPMLMAAMARAAAIGGAVGIRTNGVQDVEVCSKITGLPVIGIQKEVSEKGELCITPTFQSAEPLARAGACIIAVDCRHERPFGDPLSELIPALKERLNVLVMADCRTVADAERAVAYGADLVASTFAFQEGKWGAEPSFEVIEQMAKLPVPCIAEGGIWVPEQAIRALEVGAWAVVVGSAITRPQDITARFVRALGTIKKAEDSL